MQMIELTYLNGTPFILNCSLIETIDTIPESKVTLTTGKYYLVREPNYEIIEKIVAYSRKLLTINSEVKL